jgi:HAE1 family hydrophobic/amphiphilic exporter-1
VVYLYLDRLGKFVGGLRGASTLPVEPQQGELFSATTHPPARQEAQVPLSGL